MDEQNQNLNVNVPQAAPPTPEGSGQAEALGAPKPGFWKFYVLAFVLLVVLAFFLVWWSDPSMGGKEIVGWIAILGWVMAWPVFLTIISSSLFMGSLFNDLFNKQRRFPVLVSSLSAAIIFMLSIFSSHAFINPRTLLLSNDDGFVAPTVYAFIFITLFFLLISLVAFLLRIRMPRFWIYGVNPITLTYVILLFLFLLQRDGFLSEMVDIGKTLFSSK